MLPSTQSPLALSPFLSLSNVSDALFKSNYMCLITSRAVKPLVRGAQRSSVMATIKVGGSKAEKRESE